MSSSQEAVTVRVRRQSRHYEEACASRLQVEGQYVAVSDGTTIFFADIFLAKLST